MHTRPAIREGDPQTLHLIPRDGAWRLQREGDDAPLAVFADLGRALDAATSGPNQVRVVVHSPEAA
jgi:hypothetical protein